MNNKSVLKVACKIIGIFFLFQAVSQFKAFALYTAPVFLSKEALTKIDLYQETQYYSAFITLSGIMIDFAIALFLFFGSEWIVNRFDRKSHQEELVLPLDRVVLIELTVIAVGLFVAITAGPNVLTNLIEYFTLNNRDNESMSIFWSQGNRMGRLIFSVIEFFAGLLLASNGRGLAQRLSRVADVNLSGAEKLHRE